MMVIANIVQVLNTLLEAGFEKENFLLGDIQKLTELLDTNLKSQEGIVGFGMLKTALTEQDIV
jgi:hypothetical protein